MEERIKSELENIELEENVKIIYACESGSRAWGFPSKDSDYDVRFIYVRPIEWYLSIFDKRDVIERPINDLLDINGWDICKALQLLRKSNPPLYEWIQSPTVYDEDTVIVEQIRHLAEASFNPKSCMHHYLHMAKGNFREYLQGDFVRAKKYFYVLRPVLACRWIETNHTMPPTEFEKLLTIIHDEQLVSVITGLLNRKKAGEELDSTPKIKELNEFIDQEIKYLEELVQKIEKPEPADEGGTAPPYNFEPMQRLQDEVQRILDSAEPLTISDLAVSGQDLIRLGFQEGPELGQILNQLLHKVLSNPELNKKERLVEIAQKQKRLDKQNGGGQNYGY